MPEGTRADSGGWPGAASGGALRSAGRQGTGVSVGPAWLLSGVMCSVGAGEARDPGVLFLRVFGLHPEPRW